MRTMKEARGKTKKNRTKPALRNPYILKPPPRLTEEDTVSCLRVLVESRLEDQECRKSTFVLGINAMAEGLEQRALCSVLLSSCVRPWSLVQHIVLMCRIRNIPCFLIDPRQPNIRPLWNKIASVGCAGFGVITATASDEFVTMTKRLQEELEGDLRLPLYLRLVKVFDGSQRKRNEKHDPELSNHPHAVEESTSRSQTDDRNELS